MRLRNLFLFFAAAALLTGFPYQLNALDPSQPVQSYVHDVWNLEDGLPQNSVMALLQTRDGYLWAATQEGLVRFNGKTFTPVPLSSGDGNFSNYISALFEDDEGNLWAGASDGDIYRLNGSEIKQEIKHFNLGSDFFSYEVSSICQRRDGSTWFSTRGGGIHRILDGKVSSVYIPQITTNDILSLHTDHLDNLWIGTNGEGAVRLNKTGAVRYTASQGLAGNHIPAIYQDRDGYLWIGTSSRGLSRYSYKTGKFSNFGKPHGLPLIHITAIFQDSDGNLWFGTRGSGVVRYTGGVFSPYTTDTGLANNIVLSLTEDQEGNLWIGTDGGGLNRLKNRRFSVVDSESGLSNDVVFPILEADDGSMYIGTEGGGLNHIKNGKVTVYDTSNGLGDNKVFALQKDKKGVIWIGTYGGGVSCLENGRITRTYTTRDGLPSNIIWTMLIDSRGVLWIGTEGKGLARFKDKNFIALDSSQGLPSDRITSLLEDSGGWIWAGTRGGGLSRIRYENGKFNFTNFNTSNGLASNNILTLFEDSQGTLWIGTANGGINRYKDGKFTHCMKKHGLFDNVAFQIIEDDRGYFWIGCNKGIFTVERQQLNDFLDGTLAAVKSTVYGKADGMKSVECNGVCQPPGIKTSGGKLWFPTIKGAVVIDPASIKTNKVLPPVKIEAVLVDSKSYPTDIKNIFPPGSNNIEIRYAGLSYVDPGKVRYHYMLKGFDQAMREPGTRNTAFYTNLPPGSYEFWVIASNNDDQWNTDGAHFSFEIKPFFYQTPWFYILSGGFLFFLILGTYRFRVRRLKKRETQLAGLVDQRTLELQKTNREMEDLLVQLKKANEIAQKGREAADAANRSKSEFLARMSHEIRTPMNGVIGFAAMMLDSRLTDEQTEYAKMISRSGEALISILDEILDFSKIEAGKLTFEPIDFDPEVTAFDICELILPRVGSKQVEVLCRIGDNVPAFVKQDPGRFRQVLTNLMGNAAKFTRKGEIELAVNVAEKKEDSVKLHCTIRDTGVGIPAGKLKTIFEVFQQADGSITRKYGGTGLGLAISRQIARHMGGDVTVESEEGKGSAFHFTAWVEKSTKKTTVTPPADYLTGKRILAVDDNQHNLEILEHILKGYRLDTVTCADPACVISKLVNRPHGSPPFDLCILDIQMPGQSGYDVARAIRELKPPYGRIPLLALSSAVVSHSDDITDAGFDGFLTKPVNRKKLLKMLERMLGEAMTASTETADEKQVLTRHSLTEHAKHSVHILLAEDNPINQKLANRMLTKAGYNLDLVTNGKEAVDAISANPDRYHLVLMDIQMPEVDGRKATRLIRQNGFDKLPIIAMTAESMKGDREKCLEAGMNDYISKPIKRENVFEIIKKWVLET